MKKRALIFTLVGLAAVMLLGACGLLREPEEASAPIEAVPLEIEPEESATSAAADAGTEVPMEEEMEDEGGQEEEAEGSEEAQPPENTGEEVEESSGELVIYSIDSSQSEVRFELDEDLRGERKTVVGVTDQVAGELAVNSSDLSTAQLGTVRVNARTLLTDNDFRNRAIQNEILDTGDFEFITFEPTSVEGLPASVAVGETVSFSIVGDLTIRDIVQETVFEVEATLTSEDTIEGLAKATAARGDYDLNIPSVPNVANVEEDVELYIDFVATR